MRSPPTPMHIFSPTTNLNEDSWLPQRCDLARSFISRPRGTKYRINARMQAMREANQRISELALTACCKSLLVAVPSRARDLQFVHFKRQMQIPRRVAPRNDNRMVFAAPCQSGKRRTEGSRQSVLTLAETARMAALYFAARSYFRHRRSRRSNR